MDAIKLCECGAALAVLFFRDKVIQKLYREDLLNDNYNIYKYGLGDDALSTANFPERTIDDIIFYEGVFDTEIPEELREIFSKFVNYVDPRNIEFSLLNLRDVKIDYVDNIKDRINLLFPNYIIGFYDSIHNKISIIFNNKRVLGHEFLHMASTAYYNPLFSGFHLVSFDYDDNYVGSIGLGLNEGYTELLNSRIFYDGKFPINYEFNVEIVRLLECFFDDYRDMEWAYFHNDINSVYKQFCKYGTRDEFFLILNELDNFSKNFTMMDIVNCYKLKFKLYEVIKRSNDDEKIKRFEKVFYESPIDTIISKMGINIGQFENFSKRYFK